LDLNITTSSEIKRKSKFPTNDLKAQKNSLVHKNYAGTTNNL
jgi:hypothetical protein